MNGVWGGERETVAQFLLKLILLVCCVTSTSTASVNFPNILHITRVSNQGYFGMKIYRRIDVAWDAVNEVPDAHSLHVGMRWIENAVFIASALVDDVGEIL